MSAVILPFHRQLTAFIAKQARPFEYDKPTDGRSLKLTTQVRAYCHKHGHSAQTTRAALNHAFVHLNNGQTSDFALSRARDLADRLHKAEVDAAWGGAA